MSQKTQRLQSCPKAFLVLCVPILCFFSSCSSSCCTVPVEAPKKALAHSVQETKGDPFFQNMPLRSDWWQLFNDHQLNACIEQAFENNPTLQSAQVQIAAASYYAASIRSSLYPYVSLGADVSRQKLSKTGVIPFSSGPEDSKTPISDIPIGPNIPIYFSLYETELNMTYTFDFWNKNKNALCAALSQVQASIAEEAFLRLGLGIAVAKTYYALQTDYAREEVAKELVDNRINYLNLTQKRVNSNIGNALSLQIAESNLTDARRFLLQIQEEVSLKKHLLSAYMAGSFEETITPSEITKKPIPKAPLPQDLPLHLIARRPDITAQLWMIESAGKQIEIAKAGFYPDINLTAFFGFQTIHFAEFFKWPSTFFNIDPALSLPIFDGGRLIADLRGSEVNYDLAILEYNSLVINAAKEVLDAITSLSSHGKLLQKYESKWEHQTELYQLTKLRVRHSLDSSFEELLSKEQELLAQEQKIAALGNTFQAILNLIQALGGGYDSCGK